MPFEKGNKLAKGGARPGAGKMPDWFKKRCAEIIEKKQLVEFVGRVAAGEEMEHRMSKDGDVIELPVNIHDRLYACEMLFDRGFGKPIPAAPDLHGIAGPLQQVINDTALLKILYGLNFNGSGKGLSDSALLENRASPLQAGA